MSYDGDFYPEAPPGCDLTPLFQASPGLLLCICHITDHLQLEAEFDSIRPYLVGERIHRLLHSAMRSPGPGLIPPAMRRLAGGTTGPGRIRGAHRSLLEQCLERQNRIPAQLLQASGNADDLNRGEYYWVTQGHEESRWVRWVTTDYRMCEGPPDLFRWPRIARANEGEPSPTT